MSAATRALDSVPFDRGDDRGLQPVRRRVGDALLEERLAAGPVRVALEQHRPALHRRHDRLLHPQVVVRQVELGLPALREEHLVGAGDRHLVPRRLEGHGVVVAHRPIMPGPPDPVARARFGLRSGR